MEISATRSSPAHRATARTHRENGFILNRSATLESDGAGASVSHDGVAFFTYSLLSAWMLLASRKAYKLKKVKQSTKVTWWTQELDIKKKEMRAVQKRANNTTGTGQTRYQLLFSRKQALYKKLALRAKRTSLKNFCTQTKSPYGIPYKAVVKDNLHSSDLFKIMDQPEEGDS
ncbi:hypothetical protein AVEN_241396-1 [Araneus ventricosus]|uniref:Uncharacterized protein n=1 Tax=Araneus ventricosus TaxID=182803 RepID=A0A4Y2H0N6_ARAVE|nr:hypothetical protein AVEN_241396-1 [Araneus ventricosus]